MNNILNVKNLNVYYGETAALEGIDFSLPQGQAVSFIGESGSGKTTLLSSIAGLLPKGSQISGDIEFNGQNFYALSGKKRRQILGNQIGIIFQNPELFFDPTEKIGKQMEDYIMLQQHIKRKDTHNKIYDILNQLSFPDVKSVLSAYPFELSGGMCQRISIAMVLSCENTKLILADEPTSALDQIIRSQTAKLLVDTQKKLQASLLLVTHDIKLARDVSDYIGVMYKGKLIEWGTAEEIFIFPCHDYTRALIAASPKKDTDFLHFRMYDAATDSKEFLRKEISPGHWVLT